jgi:hypothetical protein
MFLDNTYRWLRMEGILILVIPFERLHDYTGTLSSHFASLRVFRMTDPDSVQYRQIVVFGVRREVRNFAQSHACAFKVCPMVWYGLMAEWRL